MPTPLTSAEYDVAIVGGGINGAVSAAALSSRGYKVLLVDEKDFGGVTSSQSSNLIWGGIKYLQTYEFPLVFKLCRARFRLMRNYPTRVISIGFLASLGQSAPFGRYMGVIGTLVYWAIGFFRTPAPKTFSASQTVQIEPAIAKDKFSGSVLYFDGMLPDNDSRFVWDFVKKATDLGATALNYVQLTAANKTEDGFQLMLADTISGDSYSVKTKLVVNAAGPYVKPVNDLLAVETKNGLLFSKGIHLVVPRLTSDNRILAFWDEQGRLFYVIPMHDRSVIGTTDTRVIDPAEEVTEQDREFVLRQINKSLDLDQPLTKSDIISERCGVRALVSNNPEKTANQDWHKLSRKHFVESHPAGVISILGGKFTDCLNVGDEIVHEVKRLLPARGESRKWIGEDSLTGRDSVLDLANKILGQGDQTAEVANQLWRRHGLQATEILNQMKVFPKDQERVFEGLGITFGEVKYILRNELIRTSSDLLRRRLPIAMLRSAKEIEENSRLQAILSEAGVG